MSEKTDQPIEAEREVVHDGTVTLEPYEFGASNDEPSSLDPKEVVLQRDWSAEELEKAKANKYNENHPKAYSPGEFNRRGELLEFIHNQNDNIAELNHLLRNVDTRLAEAERRGYAQAMAELNARRDTAIELGDKAAVHAVDRETEALKTTYNQSLPAAAQVDHYKAQYLEQNKEWLSDPDVYAVAQGFEQRLMNQRATLGLPPLSSREQGALIKEHVMKSFPHRFENRAQNTPSAVEAARGSSLDKGSKRGEATLDDLTARQKDSYYRIKRDLEPDLTPQEYINRLSPDYSPTQTK